MGTIAADAGVGIGTLYRHFPTRQDLLNHLTHRSFEQVLANARAADFEGSLRPGLTPADIVVFAAMLARPHPAEPDWNATCRRLLATYLRGLAPNP